MADQIVSWGGIDSKGTSGMGVTGSLGILNTNTSSSVLLDINGSANNSLTFISNPILPGGQQNGLKVNVSTAGYDANGSNIAYNFQVGGTSYFTIANYGLATFAQSISTKGILIQGNPSNTTSLIVYAQGAAGNAIETGGSEGTVHLGSNTVNTKVNEILRITGKGTTSSTTALLVQNANASGSMVVLDDGNVGIGTTSPTARQSVLAAAARPFDWGDTVARGALTFSGTSALVTALTGDLQLFTDNGVTTGITVKATSGNVGIGISTPSASLHISGSSNSALLEIDSPAVNNILYVSGSGNVGIGTGTPTSTLHVSGSSRFTGELLMSGSTQNRSAKLTDSGLFISRISDGTYPTSITADGVMYFDTRNSFIFRNDATATITFQSDTRNVLIGPDTSDLGRLVVKGSGTTSSTTSFLVQNANASSSLAVLDNGYVGIGTSSPSVSLDVAGNASFGSSQLFKITDNGSGNFDLGGATVNTYINGVTFRVRNASGNTNLYVDGGTNRVGIGTTSPSYTLDVSGSGNFTNNLTVTGSLLMPSGSNTRVGSDVLTAGSVLINNTTVTANSLIFVTPTSAGTLTGTLRIAAIVPGTSFTVSSTSITDTAAFSYFIVN